MKLQSWIITGTLVLMATVYGCSREDSYKNPPRPVRVQVVEEYSGSTGVRYSANVTPYQQVNLSFKVSGYIREIVQVRGSDGRMRDLQEGDPVTAGMVLARVTETEYIEKVKIAEAQLAQAQAALEKATDDFNRAKNLYATKSITQPDYDSARKEFESSQAAVAGAAAQLQDAKLNLNYCALTAPTSGILLQRNIEVGALVAPGSVGFVMADVTSVKVVFGVPDMMLEHVELGSQLGIRTESIPGIEFQGRITAISPAATSYSRVFNVEVTVPNSKNLLKVGMIASLEVPNATLSKSPVVVQLTAIVRSKNNPAGYAVFVVETAGDKETARFRDVKLAEVYGSTIAVTEGLNVGDKVVISGGTLITDGEQVRIIP